eukprot:scaffold39417_cov176-Amphora_coffeaeformis.AAC.2
MYFTVGLPGWIVFFCTIRISTKFSRTHFFEYSDGTTCDCHHQMGGGGKSFSFFANASAAVYLV